MSFISLTAVVKGFTVLSFNITNYYMSISHLETDKLESLCIEVRLGKTKWLIARCYKNSDIKNNDFETFMTPFLDGIIAASDRFILMRDLNFDILSIGNCLSHISDLFDLHNFIDVPTCSKAPAGTLLDVILTPSPRSTSTHGVIETGLSDWHRLDFMVTKMHAPKVMPKNITYRSFKTFNEDKYFARFTRSPIPCC